MFRVLHVYQITYNFSGTLDGLAFLDQTIRTEEHNTDLASLQVHAHALDTRCKPVFYEHSVPCPVFLVEYLCSMKVVRVDATYPTDKTRPVSARLASSCTPLIRCSRIDETSVGDAFASAA